LLLLESSQRFQTAGASKGGFVPLLQANLCPKSCATWADSQPDF
jgi:hypothetical protein